MLHYIHVDVRFTAIIQVSLSNIKGTGPDGHIVKADIEDYLGSFLIPFFSL